MITLCAPSHPEWSNMDESSASRTAMVDNQVRPSDVTKFPVIKALLSVPKEAFVPATMKPVAYADIQIPFSQDRDRVILDARNFAKMLDATDIQPDELVLDIGCGLGYSAAVVSRLAQAVVAVEEIPELAEEAEALLVRQNVDNAIVIRAPLAEGSARHSPYDVIIIEGGIEFVPDAIIDQLKDGGRIFGLFGSERVCRGRLGKKVGDRIHWRNEFDAGVPVLPGFRRERSFESRWNNEDELARIV